MPRIKPHEVEVKVGDWVCLNLKTSAIWKDEYSGINLSVWGDTYQQIPPECDNEDLDRIRKGVVTNRLFVLQEKPADVAKAREMGERSVYLRELLTHSTDFIKGKLDTLSNTDIECLYNLEFRKKDQRKSLIKVLSAKIKTYASEFAAGTVGAGKEGMVENFVRERVEDGKRPLKDEPPDTPLNKEPEVNEPKKGRAQRK